MPLTNTLADSEETDNLERRWTIFQKLDVDGDGMLSEADMVRGLERLGLPSRRNITRCVMERADLDGDGLLNFEEFNTYCEWKERYLRREFDRLDQKRLGVLTVEDIKRALKDLGGNANGPEMKGLAAHIRGDMHGYVDFSEWCRLFGFVPFDKEGIRQWFEVWQRQSPFNALEDNVLPNDESLAPSVTFTSGAVSGIVSRTATAPLERLKILAQLRGNHRGADLLPARWGVLSGIRAMQQEGGIPSLFRGNLANCLKVAPQGGIQWFVFEYLKQIFTAPGTDSALLPSHVRFLCGAGAGMASQACIYPLETVKTRLSVAPSNYYRGITDCVLRIVRQEGTPALFRGLGTALIGRIPYSGVDLTIYETLKYSYKSLYGKEDRPPVHVLLLCGTFSSACGQTCAYPFAFCRSNLQAQGMSPSTAEQYRGLWDCMRGTVRSKGVLGLYAGLYANLLQCLPASGIGYVTYEYCKSMLGALNF
eukprot:GGOE01063490.1.p1 GENE.GGOE01063490.1~~GGOE01063490.1.p1  ORF type:complete len:479 (-),score=115.02 GGOE01063490.1:503-1939(-)